MYRNDWCCKVNKTKSWSFSEVDTKEGKRIIWGKKNEDFEDADQNWET